MEATDFLTSITLLVNYKRHEENGKAVSCKKKDVLNLSLEEYKNNADILTEGFLLAEKFLKEQRIFSNKNLPYSTQLIPLAVIFTILGKDTHNSSVKKKISRWYWCGVLGEMYGGANETRYVLDVTGLISWIKNDKEEPDTIKRAYFNATRLLSLQSRLSAAYKGVMALIIKEGCVDFISETSIDFSNYIEDNIDIHHIFPKSYCEKKGYKRAKWNSIVNKTPLSARTNRIIGGSAPSKYLCKIIQYNKISEEELNERLESHKINVEHIKNDDFDLFFIDRTKEILNIISKEMGKPISNLDSEEVEYAFGKTLL